MTGVDQSRTNHKAHGFSLLELILAVILLGIAGSIVVVGLSSLSGMVQERKVVVDAQLAQERLELILAEKRNSGFPSSNASAHGPDPCTLYNLSVSDYPACDTNKIAVGFSNQNEGYCYKSTTNNCTVTVSVHNGPEFVMLLYEFE